MRAREAGNMSCRETNAKRVQKLRKGLLPRKQQNRQDSIELGISDRFWRKGQLCIQRSRKVSKQEGPIFFFNVLFIFETETEHEQGRDRERGRHRSKAGCRLQALSCQHRVGRGARTQEPWDHDLSQSWTLNQLSHPGTPRVTNLKEGTD